MSFFSAVRSGWFRGVGELSKLTRTSAVIIRLLRGPDTGRAQTDAIVTVTTYPARAGGLWLTLLTLLDQSVKPVQLVIVLSRVEFESVRQLPLMVRLMIWRFSGEVQVLFDEGNIKSFKKLVPALESFPNSVIITADDDVLYSYRWLAALWAWHRRFPEVVIGARGLSVPSQIGGAYAPYRSWARARPGRAAFDVLPTGVGGILYPPMSLSAEVTNRPAMLSCAPSCDDMWFKSASLARGSLCLIASEGESLFQMRRIGIRHGLWEENVVLGRNDQAWLRSLCYFGLEAVP